MTVTEKIPVRPVEPELVRLASDATVPDDPLLPTLVYRNVLETTAGDPAAAFAALFAANGWGGIWYDGVFPFPHYHSTAHEVLGIARGRVRLRLGGRRRLEFEARAGDALVLPAGTSHQNLGATADLLVVGAYPAGRRWDLLRGRPEELETARVNIARVPLPATDPLFGADGPLVRLWRAEAVDRRRSG